MIDAKDLPPPPRETRMTRAHADARRGWAVAASVAGVVLLAFLLRENARWQALARRGVTVQGRVTGRRVIEGKSTTDFLTVDFPVAGTTRTDEFSVTGSEYAGYPEGASVPVRVDPDDATNTRLFGFDGGDADRLLLRWGLGLLAAGALVGLGFRADADADAVRLQRKRLALWPLGAMTVDRVLPAEAKQTGLFLSGHYVDARGERQTVSKLHLPSGFQVQETVPVLYDESSDGVVALASLDRVEPA